MYDIRYLLFVALIVLYRKTWVYYVVNKRVRRMPLLVGFALIALFIWLAENIGTFTGVWLYPDQVQAWHMVGFEKIGAWLLLMVISFIMIDMLYVVRARLARR